MSSFKESVGGIGTQSNEPVDLSDGESVELVDGLGDEANEPEVNDANEGAKRRRTSSEVWEHFISVEEDHKGKKVKKYECKHCKIRYVVSNGRPTSTLKRHMNRCHHILKLKGKKRGFNFDSCGNDGINSLNMDGGYEHKKCKEMIAKMIIAHELPFSFVEYHWFNQLMKYNNPLYQKVSRSTITRECIKYVDVEKEKMKKFFKNVDVISLTSDCWTSNQTVGYMCLTAHFIDSNWKLRKVIIGFNELEPPHSGEVISDGILECLIKWGIQDKIGTITLDNASNNDREAMFLKNNFQGRGKLYFEGLFFHIRCCAHILNLVVQDGLATIDSCIVKIREGVKYLKKSPGRLLKFGEVATTHGINTRRSLCTDVKTRWNSTHRMLESAIYYKRAFQGYALRDQNFEWTPTDDEWTRAGKVCEVLEVFLHATNLFSGTSYPTSNLFLIEIFKVKKKISSLFASKDNFLKSMSVPMYEKFEKYWGEIGVLMSIASILDPRFKMMSINWTFKQLYPSKELDSRVEDVTEKLKFLFEKYANDFMVARAATISSMTPSSSNHEANQEDDFFAYLNSKPVESSEKSELDVYLEEPNHKGLEKEFDVLIWWSQSSSKYPILSKMARDIFSIPITTVASESAFSAGGRILDDYRSSLKKDTVEILVCGGDWIKGASKVTLQTLYQSAKDEENLEIEIPTNDLTT